jgi:hypothetical protein
VSLLQNHDLNICSFTHANLVDVNCIGGGIDVTASLRPSESLSANTFSVNHNHLVEVIAGIGVTTRIVTTIVTMI